LDARQRSNRSKSLRYGPRCPGGKDSHSAIQDAKTWHDRASYEAVLRDTHRQPRLRRYLLRIARRRALNLNVKGVGNDEQEHGRRAWDGRKTGRLVGTAR